MTTKSVDINGMSCQMCVRHVTNALSAIPGVRVRNVQVGSAEIEFDPQSVGEDQILEAVREAGYEARARD